MTPQRDQTPTTREKIQALRKLERGRLIYVQDRNGSWYPTAFSRLVVSRKSLAVEVWDVMYVKQDRFVRVPISRVSLTDPPGS